MKFYGVVFGVVIGYLLGEFVVVVVVGVFCFEDGVCVICWWLVLMICIVGVGVMVLVELFV